MAKYFYVKTGGTATTATATATTDPSTKRTSTWSATAGDHFASIALALLGDDTSAPSSGDIICVSDLHARTGDTDVTYQGPTTGDAVYITSVDDGNCDTEKVAVSAQEYMTRQIYFKGNISTNGLYIKSGRSNNNMGTNIVHINPTFEVLGSTYYFISAVLDGTSVKYINPTFIGAAGSFVYITSGSLVTIDGGSLSGITDNFVKGGFVSGGGTLIINGCDLSTITGTLIKDVGSDAVNDDAINIQLNKCKLNASAIFTNEEFSCNNHNLTITNSAPTSAPSEYQYHDERRGGFVDDQSGSGIHRDESTAFPSGTKVSAHCATNTLASKAMPFWFDLPTRFSELSTATDTIRVYLTSTTTLYDSDVWVDVIYADGTNNHEFNFITSKHSNMLDTNGTELTSDTGSTWKNGVSDLAGYNEYYIDIDTSTDAGGDCVPMLKVYVGKASTVIYFDTSIGVI